MTRRQIVLALLLLALIIAALVLWVLPGWLFHPLTGRGYQFWSGIAGSFLLGGGIWSGLAVTYWKHTCGAPLCPRIGRHPTADGLTHLCRKHHPELPNRKLSLAEIHERHHAAKNERASS